jgi:hypothetical protein
MNIDANDIGFIIGGLGILGVLFSVYNYFRKPQEDIETKQALAEKEISSKATILAQKEIENKANVLAQQVQWEKEANEKKFCEFGLRLDGALAMAQNHIHTVDVKVDNLITTVGKMSNEITRLATIIDERIPKQK